MKQGLKWLVAHSADGKQFEKPYPALVPGNAQWDYARAHRFAHNWDYASNFHKFDGLEDGYWRYTAEIPPRPAGYTQTTFTALGIDYICEIFFNNERLRMHEGMFSPISLVLPDSEEGGTLTVLIHPIPKHPLDADDRNITSGNLPPWRSEGDRIVKPVMQYGWDNRPRVIMQGIWDEAFVTFCKDVRFTDCTLTYALSGPIVKCRADVHVRFDCKATGGTVRYRVCDKKGTLYEGYSPEIDLASASLWYPWTHGKQPLYTLTAELLDASGAVVDSYTRRVGFRRAELTTVKQQWREPQDFPKGRSTPPFTVTINGIQIFAKGANWCSPEMFAHKLTRARYREMLRSVKDCNMNFLRMHAGSEVCREPFFELCDEMGILLWQEFPLACNRYADDPHYLAILEQEATAVVRRLRTHPSVVLWCGGNELFNSWSKMTEQSHALRLLNKVCFEQDPHTPYINTSPIMGVHHGFYQFYSDKGEGDVMQIYRRCHSTAYPECGVCGMSDSEMIRAILPPEEHELLMDNQNYRDHFAFGTWKKESWACKETNQMYFGKTDRLDDHIAYSRYLQYVGMPYVFEEARRQAPYCSMALMWCYNDVLRVVASSSLISYPTAPKPAYGRVRDALAGVTPSLRHDTYLYERDATFTGEVHLLNDTGKRADVTEIAVFVEGKNGRRAVATLHAEAASANVYFGDFSFSVADMCALGSLESVPTARTILDVVLVGGGLEKRYPILVKNDD